MQDKTNSEYQVLLTEMHEVVSSKAESAIAARIELRDAVCRYVDAEQTRGTMLAVIIRSVEEILAKAEDGTEHASKDLARQLIEWCRQFHGKHIAAPIALS